MSDTQVQVLLRSRYSSGCRPRRRLQAVAVICCTLSLVTVSQLNFALVHTIHNLWLALLQNERQPITHIDGTCWSQSGAWRPSSTHTHTHTQKRVASPRATHTERVACGRAACAAARCLFASNAHSGASLVREQRARSAWLRVEPRAVAKNIGECARRKHSAGPGCHCHQQRQDSLDVVADAGLNAAIHVPIIDGCAERVEAAQPG